ncbi:MAG: hypothetical protein GXO32_00725 [Crenarchaeota archaeon]|nr:hypothetical protein [Thermoproteota archaeon]
MRVVVAGCSELAMAALDALSKVAAHSEILIVDEEPKRASMCVDFGFGAVKCVSSKNLQLQGIDIVIDTGVLSLETLKTMDPSLGFVSLTRALSNKGVGFVNPWSLIKALLRRARAVLNAQHASCAIRRGSCAIIPFAFNDLTEIRCVENGAAARIYSEKLLLRDVDCEVLAGLLKLVNMGVLSLGEARSIVHRYCRTLGSSCCIEVEVEGFAESTGVAYSIKGDAALVTSALIEVALEALADGLRGSLEEILSYERIYIKALSRLISRGTDLRVEARK